MIDLTNLTASELAAVALFLFGCLVCIVAAVLVIVDMIYPMPRSTRGKGDESIG